MKDEDPQAPEPESSSGGGTTPPTASGDAAGERNQWDFEAPDPMLSFHGDIPTDPGALQDRPTGASVPPPSTQAATTTPGVDASATPPHPPSVGADPAATRVVPQAPPLASGTTTGEAPPRRVGTRTAAMLVGVAALVGLLIVAGLAFTGGDEGETVATGITPAPVEPPTPTPQPTPTPTPGPTATPEPPPSATTELSATTAPYGGAVAERWDLQDGRLTSTIEITNDTDAAVEGLQVVIVPNSIAGDPTSVSFDPEPAEEVEADDRAVVFPVALAPGDPPLTITWSAEVETAAGETLEDALERLLGDRAAAAFRFAADGPDLTIDAPAEGSATIDSSVTLRGRTDPDATVTVAGARVAVNDSNGRFRTEIERTRDRREIRIVATDPYGRSTELTWTVRFTDPDPTPTPAPVVVPTTRPVAEPTPRPTPTPQPLCLPGQPGCR